MNEMLASLSLAIEGAFGRALRRIYERGDGDLGHCIAMYDHNIPGRAFTVLERGKT